MNQELREGLESIQRLSALERTHLMDSPPEEGFDRLTRLASRILNVPVALVSLVDDRRQFFKSCVGLTAPWSICRETPLSHSFCQHVVLSELPLIVNDAREHPVLRHNLAVSELGVIAYAGIPIRTTDGLVLGSFCVIYTKPRVWTKDDVEILTELTGSVMTEVALGSAIRQATERSSEVTSSEARKNAILESALDGIITIDEQGTILEFNPAAERVFGYRTADVLGRQMSDLIIPSHQRASHQAGLERYLKTATSRVLGKRIEITAMHADGTEFPVELAISVIRDKHRVFTAYVRDITETRRAAESIERSRMMLDAIQRAQRRFIAEGDARATFEHLLKNLLTLTDSESGFIAETLYREDGSAYIKTHAITNVSWDDESRALYAKHEAQGLEFSNLKSLYGAVLTTGQRVISNAPSRDARVDGFPAGHPAINSFLGVPFYHGDEMVGMIGISNRPGGYDDELCGYLAPFIATCSSLIAAFRVRKQRRLIEEALRTERDFVAAVLETVGTPVVIVDRTGVIVGFNRASAEIAGYTSAEVLGKYGWEAPYVLEEDRPGIIDFWKDFQDGGMPATYESYWLTRSGELRLMTWSYSALRDEEGKITNMVACAIDITSQRAHEVALAQARQNEIEIGTRIQQTLLVRKPNENLCGFSIGTLSRASQDIDGDFFDFFSYDGSCFDFLIGDVMGKGIPAALLGAAGKSHFQRSIRRLQTFMRDFDRLPRPEEIITAVHTAMTPDLARLNSFITLAYTRFDPANRCLQMIDCGHTRTIHYHKRGRCCTFLKGDNLPLGVLEDERFKPISIPLEPGDVLFFYSDGITDSRSQDGAFFGENRLIATVQENSHLPPQAMVEQIGACVSAFTGDAFGDDLTCVAIRFDESAIPAPHTRTIREFRSSMDELESIRQYVSNFCRFIVPKPLNEDVIHLVLLGIQEAVTNIIKHACEGLDDQKVQFTIDWNADQITFHLYDCGLSFDPTQTAEPDFEGNREDGFGMFIISQCMDDVRYERDDLGRNHAIFTRNLSESDRRDTEDRGFYHEI